MAGISVNFTIEQGYLDGVSDGKQEAARNMLRMGLGTHEQIAQITGLSIEDIRALVASAPKPVLA